MQIDISAKSISDRLREINYAIDDDFAITVFLSIKLNKPLLLEGPPGVGKTELALVLSKMLNTKLIRLQCYEGLDVNDAVYEWNYQRQLLSIKLQEQENKTVEEKEAAIFNEKYLLKRPLLQAILEEDPPVLLIDEIDRSDEEFEAYLLELLSAYQISIPEMGTIVAKSKPIVILTSNRTRELSDALKRRCLYYWIDYPTIEKEMQVISMQLPAVEEKLAAQIAMAVKAMRQEKLSKKPGISETLDWAQSIEALGYKSINQKVIYETIGSIVKSVDDQQMILSLDWEGTLLNEKAV
jgi:MoxR-like ATPase